MTYHMTKIYSKECGPNYRDEPMASSNDIATLEDESRVAEENLVVRIKILHPPLGAGTRRRPRKWLFFIFVIKIFV
jgi:hypothetical protein